MDGMVKISFTVDLRIIGPIMEHSLQCKQYSEE